MADGFDLVTKSQAATNQYFRNLNAGIAAVSAQEQNVLNNAVQTTSLAAGIASNNLALKERIRFNDARIKSSQIRDRLAEQALDLDQSRFGLAVQRATDDRFYKRAAFNLSAGEEISKLHRLELKEAIMGGLDPSEAISEYTKKERERIKSVISDSILDESAQPSTTEAELERFKFIGENPELATQEILGRRAAETDTKPLGAATQALLGAPVADEPKPLPEGERADPENPFFTPDLETEETEGEKENKETASALSKDLREVGLLQEMFEAEPANLRDLLDKKVAASDVLKSEIYTRLSNIDQNKGDVTDQGLAKDIAQFGANPNIASTIINAVDARNRAAGNELQLRKALSDQVKDLIEARKLVGIDLGEPKSEDTISKESEAVELLESGIDELTSEINNSSKIKREQQGKIDTILDQYRPSSLTDTIDPADENQPPPDPDASLPPFVGDAVDDALKSPLLLII
jgi:hypothetical protein